MFAWLRLLLLALLIPAYGWAAVPWVAGTSPQAVASSLSTHCAATPSPLSAASDGADNTGLLDVQDVADTSSELPEHGLPAAGEQPTQPGTHKPSAPTWPEAPGAPPQRLLRPPMHQA